MTARHDRARLYRLISFYVALAVGWMLFAGWVAAPLLTAKQPAKTAGAVKYYIESFASAFLPRGITGRWRQFTVAVVIAIFLHLTIVLFLRRLDARAARQRSPADLRLERWASRWLAVISSVFLGVTLVTGPVHDYHYYLNMWYEVEQGHDPWFVVAGSNGIVPLNAYGPVFNLLAGLDWMNPLAPKLLFAFAYIAFTVVATKGFMASHQPTFRSLAVLTILFWNPFPWVEIAIRGHFDILVALLCLGAIRSWFAGRDVAAGTYLALGILLKYFPIVLLPFLALDRGRIRWKVLLVTITLVVLGMGISYLIWGPALFKPLTFAATRASTFMSIYFFLRGRYSPLLWVIQYPDCDFLATPILIVALLRAWSWYRTRHPDFEAACVVAVITTAIFYRTGFPQYHMMPFVLGADWAVRHWGELSGRPGRLLAIAAYPAWLAILDSFYLFVHGEDGPRYWGFLQQTAGLPTFLFGCAFLAAVVHSAARTDQRDRTQPENRERDAAGTEAGRSE